MRIGNVIKDPHGNLWIVTGVDERVVQAVSFDSENCRATQRWEDHTETRTCLCGDHPDFMGRPQEDCEQCKGTGRYEHTGLGWKRCEVLAPNVKEFIMKGLLNNFGFDR